MTWEEALNALEQYARDERRGLANDARSQPFVPPPGRLPVRLQARAEEVLAELRATELVLAADLARLAGTIHRKSTSPSDVDFGKEALNRWA